jgi:hypothetical protein
MKDQKIIVEPKHYDNLANALNQFLIPALQKSPKPEQKKQDKGA